ncbi:MAG: hypothetical protein Q4P20_08970 [Eubacteriales bacterium]|nr:hypothetical protein [Eubacteriales bacterium]
MNVELMEISEYKYLHREFCAGIFHGMQYWHGETGKLDDIFETVSAVARFFPVAVGTLHKNLQLLHCILLCDMV